MDYAILEWEHDEVKKKAFIENLAPIVLFTYNRLNHTKQTIEALQNNVYAEESHLYIYSDAPKNEQARENVLKVRSYIKTVTGFKKITVIERDKNWGLANSVIDGVTDIVNKYGKIIVLEDDIVTSKYFLKYMNDALMIYDNEKKVMQISGYGFPLENNDLPETFFLAACSCWGWSTWVDRWRLFERNPNKLVQQFDAKKIKKFNFDNTYDYWQQIIDNNSGILHTWAIFWYATIFEYGGVTLFPKYSLVRNNGFDDSGQNCSTTNCFNVLLNENNISYFNNDIKENEQARNDVKKFFRGMKQTIFKKIFNKIRSFIKYNKDK